MRLHQADHRQMRVREPPLRVGWLPVPGSRAPQHPDLPISLYQSGDRESFDRVVRLGHPRGARGQVPVLVVLKES